MAVNFSNNRPSRVLERRRQRLEKMEGYADGQFEYVLKRKTEDIDDDAKHIAKEGEDPYFYSKNRLQRFKNELKEMKQTQQSFYRAKIRYERNIDELEGVVEDWFYYVHAHVQSYNSRDLLDVTLDNDVVDKIRAGGEKLWAEIDERGRRLRVASGEESR